MKPQYHISPPKGFLNDPNGLAQFQGIYHVFYQWMPEVQPQGSKSWRHCVSEDLIHWKDLGCGLEPTEWYEKNGCYSGSGITNENKYYLFYTGNVKDEKENRSTYQCLAVSEDGSSFKKEGPVVYLPDEYTPHFRDPKVWKAEGNWWMAVGAQTKELCGNVALLKSEDLYHWKYRGKLLDPKFDGGYMCECPDYFQIGVREYIILSVQKTTGCRGVVFEGKMNYQIGSFDIISQSGKLLDEGFDFYAPQSFQDESGRRLLFAWLGAGELDYQLSQPTVKEGWLHCLTIPRELYMYDGKLCQRPVKELETIRRQEHTYEISGEEKIKLASASMELYCRNISEQSMTIQVGEVLSIIFEKEKKKVIIRRKKWQQEGNDEKQIPMERIDEVRVFVDQSTAEIFFNHGETVFTCKIFGDNKTDLRITTKEKVSLTTWLMEG